MQTDLPFLPVAETDQVHCYDPDGRRIDCAGTGQDGSRPKRQKIWDADRFRALGEIVRDTHTGIVWSRNANPAEFPLTWDEARAFVTGMSERRAHGITDWQLPTRRLLFSLISHQAVNPVLPSGHPFTNVFNGYYWTDATVSRLTDQAWYVHMGGGRVHRGMKQGSYLVWPASRGAVRHPAIPVAGPQRFISADDGIYDALTGLTWRRDADAAGGPLTWPDALSAVDHLNRTSASRHNDWRLPTIRELESLVDLTSHSPALSAGHPFIRVQSGYWSSTTSVYEARYAWVLYIRDGIVGVGFKPAAEFHLWPVRGQAVDPPSAGHPPDMG